MIIFKIINNITKIIINMFMKIINNIIFILPVTVAGKRNREEMPLQEISHFRTAPRLQLLEERFDKDFWASAMSQSPFEVTLQLKYFFN